MAIKARAKKKSQIGGGTMILLMLVLGIAIVYRPALVILLALGLIPTFVAWLTDSHAFRDYRIRIIFAFNVAGCLPYVISINEQSGGFNLAFSLVSDFNSYLVMYGFAAVGWIIVFVAPSVAAFILQMMAKGRLNTIRNQKISMMEEWGKTVAGLPDEEDEDEAELIEKLNKSTGS